MSFTLVKLAQTSLYGKNCACELNTGLKVCASLLARPVVYWTGVFTLSKISRFERTVCTCEHLIASLRFQVTISWNLFDSFPYTCCYTIFTNRESHWTKVCATFTQVKFERLNAIKFVQFMPCKLYLS